MSTRIVRISDEQRNEIAGEGHVGGAEDPGGCEVCEALVAFDAAPDEATLPTIDWCVTHGKRSHLFVCDGRIRETCRVVRVPLPVHLGVEVTP